MTTKEAFTHLLHTRGALVALGMDRRNVGNMKARIKNDRWPLDATMFMYLTKAGYVRDGDGWVKS